MAENITKLKIFISCPSDVEQLRGFAEKAIEEVSRTLEVTSSKMIRHLNWRKDIVPGVAQDPQQVVNNQTIRSYDIYLGLLGCRFGTATPRAGSGTEEEFDIALEQFRSAPNSIRILFYFQGFGANPLHVDVGELAKVQAFQRKLRERGVFYNELGSLDEALSSIKSHLLTLISNEWNDAANAWADGNPTRNAYVSSPTNAIAPVSKEAQPLVQLGLLDMQELGASEVTLAGASMQNLGEHLRGVTELTEALTTDLAASSTTELKREVLDRYASNVESFNEGVRGELANFRYHLTEGAESWETFYRIVKDKGMQIPESGSQVIAAIESVEPSLRLLRNASHGAAKMVSELPALTRSFIIAQKTLVETFGSIALELTVALERLALMKTRLADS